MGSKFILGILEQTEFANSIVKVDEEGTEEEAVTSVGIGATAVPEFFTVRVDRPFLLVLHDKHSNALLFMGKIVDPPSS